MTTLARSCFALCAALAISAQAAQASAVLPSADGVVTGVVQEVKDVDGYTYVRLKNKDGETWAAVSTAPLKPGATISIGDALVMDNFESKALKKKFSTIIFGSLVGSGKTMAGAQPVAAPQVTGTVAVAKATGASARTVAEVVGKSGELKDQQVRIRGRVVKYNSGIMGKNWIHLRDGTGSEADNSNDILVTSAGQAKVGDVVTISGTVRVDKDFGGGYAYKVMIEDATIQP